MKKLIILLGILIVSWLMFPDMSAGVDTIKYRNFTTHGFEKAIPESGLFFKSSFAADVTGQVFEKRLRPFEVIPSIDIEDISIQEALILSWKMIQPYISDYKKLGIFGIIFLVTQVLMFLSRSSFKYIKGKAGLWKYAVVTGLSFLGVVSYQLYMGDPGIDVVSDASTIAAFQVFIHQFVKRIWRKKAIGP